MPFWQRGNPINSINNDGVEDIIEQETREATADAANQDLDLNLITAQELFREQWDILHSQLIRAVERGDVPSTRQYLAQAKTTGMNLNCLDPLGRTALLVAIENENIEMIELLLSHGVEVGDALLHAINEENVEAVEMLLNHEIITKGEQQVITLQAGQRLLDNWFSVTPVKVLTSALFVVLKLFV
ncbi:short transient receptor potential channel 5 [Elysia marginata]|uniref:Short transient receptor potential channel 5 n=1 Tax=Elysia marginata TaxID=1093978 RepID=A0AAV4I1P1_9GAST|nr:short transient receptor potential channel 5 [Elysia marginata]